GPVEELGAAHGAVDHDGPVGPGDGPPYPPVLRGAAPAGRRLPRPCQERHPEPDRPGERGPIARAMQVNPAVSVRQSQGNRLEQIGELLRPTARAIRWAPLLGAIVVAFIQVFVQTRETCPPTNPCVGPEARVLAL